MEKENIILTLIVVGAIALMGLGAYFMFGSNPADLTNGVSGDITISQLHDNLDQDFQYLDIRTSAEYNGDTGLPHLSEFTLNIDYYQFQSNMSMLDGLDKNKPVIIICRTGSRTSVADDLMINYGFKTVYNVLGGITEWYQTY